MESHYVTLSGHSLNLGLVVRADDIAKGPLDITTRELGFFCSGAAMNTGIFSQLDGKYVLLVNVQRGSEPPVAMEMVVNSPFQPDTPEFRRQEVPGMVPAELTFHSAASFAVAWSERFLQTADGRELLGGGAPDVILGLRAAFMKATAPFVRHLYVHITPLGDEGDDGEGIFQIAEELIFLDDSIAYFTPLGVSLTLPDELYYEPDEDTEERPRGHLWDTSPMGDYVMVSLAKH